MNNNPLVSIITPCYNSENYLVRYLKNILTQTYPCVELIVVNDGSTDKTEEIVLSYIEKYKERNYSLVYIKQENKGLGGAISTGLKYITGEYFAWCDSDNFYTADYIEKKVNYFLNNPRYSIVRCDGYIVRDTDIYKPIAYMATSKEDKTQEDMFENCLYVQNFHFGCAMLKTADFDKINPNREIYPSREGQNWQLLLPMFYHYKSGYIDEPLFYFVYRADSVSNRTQKMEAKVKYKQQEEYCKIITTTLQSIKPVREQEYIEKIQIKYSKECLKIAAKARDISRLKKEKAFLKEKNAFGFQERMIYLRGKYLVFRIVYNCLVFPKRIYSKLKRGLNKLILNKAK